MTTQNTLKLFKSGAPNSANFRGGGGLHRGSQDLTKGGCNNFLICT